MSGYPPEIVELARRVWDQLPSHIRTDVEFSARDLCDAILSQEKPKEARKVEAWLIKCDGGSVIGVASKKEEAHKNAAYMDQCWPNQAPHWICYVTGTEGIGPQDTPPTEEKQEKAREWEVYEYDGGVMMLSPPWIDGVKRIRVREVKE